MSDQSMLGQKRFCGVAKVEVHLIEFPPSKEKSFIQSHADRWKAIYQNDPSEAKRRQNKPVVQVSHSAFLEALQRSKISENDMKRWEEEEFFLKFKRGELLCLDGMSRLKATSDMRSYSGRSLWWYVNIYLDTNGVDGTERLAFGYSMQNPPNRGELYRAIRLCTPASDEYHELRKILFSSSLYVREGGAMKENLTKIERCSVTLAAFDSVMLHIPGVVPSFLLGNAKKYHATHCEIEYEHWLREYLRKFWFTLVDNDPAKVDLIDAATVEALEGLAPGISDIDYMAVENLFNKKSTLKDFDLDDREKIRSRLLGYKGMIPSLTIFDQHMKCLLRWSASIKKLFDKKTGCNLPVYTALERMYDDDRNGSRSREIQISTDEWITRKGTKQQRWLWSYRQLWLFIMRNDSRGDGSIDESSLGYTARRLGFKSKKIEALSRNYKTQGEGSRSNEELDASTIFHRIEVEERKRQTKTKYWDKPEWRNASSRLFLDEVEKQASEGTEVTYLFIQSCIYHGFFGTPPLPTDTVVPPLGDTDGQDFSIASESPPDVEVTSDVDTERSDEGSPTPTPTPTAPMPRTRYFANSMRSPSEEPISSDELFSTPPEPASPFALQPSESPPREQLLPRIDLPEDESLHLDLPDEGTEEEHCQQPITTHLLKNNRDKDGTSIGREQSRISERSQKQRPSGRNTRRQAPKFVGNGKKFKWQRKARKENLALPKDGSKRKVDKDLHMPNADGSSGSLSADSQALVLFELDPNEMDVDIEGSDTDSSMRNVDASADSQALVPVVSCPSGTAAGSLSSPMDDQRMNHERDEVDRYWFLAETSSLRMWGVDHNGWTVSLEEERVRMAILTETTHDPTEPSPQHAQGFVEEVEDPIKTPQIADPQLGNNALVSLPKIAATNRAPVKSSCHSLMNKSAEPIPSGTLATLGEPPNSTVEDSRGLDAQSIEPFVSQFVPSFEPDYGSKDSQYESHGRLFDDSSDDDSSDDDSSDDDGTRIGRGESQVLKLSQNQPPGGRHAQKHWKRRRNRKNKNWHKKDREKNLAQYKDGSKKEQKALCAAESSGQDGHHGLDFPKDADCNLASVDKDLHVPDGEACGQALVLSELDPNKMDVNLGSCASGRNERGSERSDTDVLMSNTDASGGSLSADSQALVLYEWDPNEMDVDMGYLEHSDTDILMPNVDASADSQTLVPEVSGPSGTAAGSLSSPMDDQRMNHEREEVDRYWFLAETSSLRMWGVDHNGWTVSLEEERVRMAILTETTHFPTEPSPTSVRTKHAQGFVEEVEEDENPIKTPQIADPQLGNNALLSLPKIAATNRAPVESSLRYSLMNKSAEPIPSGTLATLGEPPNSTVEDSRGLDAQSIEPFVSQFVPSFEPDYGSEDSQYESQHDLGTDRSNTSLIQTQPGNQPVANEELPPWTELTVSRKVQADSNHLSPSVLDIAGRPSTCDPNYDNMNRALENSIPFTVSSMRPHQPIPAEDNHYQYQQMGPSEWSPSGADLVSYKHRETVNTPVYPQGTPQSKNQNISDTASHWTIHSTLNNFLENINRQQFTSSQASLPFSQTSFAVNQTQPEVVFNEQVASDNVIQGASQQHQVSLHPPLQQALGTPLDPSQTSSLNEMHHVEGEAGNPTNVTSAIVGCPVPDLSGSSREQEITALVRSGNPMHSKRRLMQRENQNGSQALNLAKVKKVPGGPAAWVKDNSSLASKLDFNFAKRLLQYGSMRHYSFIGKDSGHLPDGPRKNYLSPDEDNVLAVQSNSGDATSTVSEVPDEARPIQNTEESALDSDPRSTSPHSSPISSQGLHVTAEQSTVPLLGSKDSIAQSTVSNELNEPYPLESGSTPAMPSPEPARDQSTNKLKRRARELIIVKVVELEKGKWSAYPRDFRTYEDLKSWITKISETKSVQFYSHTSKRLPDLNSPTFHNVYTIITQQLDKKLVIIHTESREPQLTAVEAQLIAEQFRQLDELYERKRPKITHE